MEPASKRHPLITGAEITSFGTLASRGLGLLRDMATAALLGMSKGPVADAFWFAFRIPNLFRQLFGEGAMTASYLPVLTIQLENDRHVARQLASVVVTLLALLLAALVAIGELLFGLVWLIWGDVEGVGLLMGLSAVMLPYLLLICVAAQLTTMLYAARHFTVPALTPTMLNIVWLVAAWAVAPWFAGNQVAQAYVLAVAVLVAGVAQVAGAVADAAAARVPFRLPLAGGPPRSDPDHAQHGPHDARPGGDANQHVCRQPDCVGIGGGAGRAAIHLLAGREGALPHAAGRRGRDLLWRPALRVSLGRCGPGRGGGHLSALGPARRPRRLPAVGRRYDGRPAAGVLSGRAGGRGTLSLGAADHAAVLPARSSFSPKTRFAPRGWSPGTPPAFGRTASRRSWSEDFTPWATTARRPGWPPGWSA